MTNEKLIVIIKMILKIVVIKILSYRKMSKDSSAWYHKKNKEKKIQKESSEKYQNLSKMEKSKKSYSMGVKDSKISLKIKSKG